MAQSSDNQNAEHRPDAAGAKRVAASALHRVPAETKPLEYLANNSDALSLPKSFTANRDVLTDNIIREIDGRKVRQEGGPDIIDKFFENYSLIERSIGPDRIKKIRDNVIEKYGSTDAPLSDYTVIGILNATHDNQAQDRFDILRGKSPDFLKELLTHDEAYPSTFNGVMNELQRQLALKGETPSGYLDGLIKSDPSNAQMIIDNAAKNGRLDDFTQTMAPEQVSHIMETISSSQGWESLKKPDHDSQQFGVNILSPMPEMARSIARKGAAESKEEFLKEMVDLAKNKNDPRASALIGTSLYQFGLEDPTALASYPEAAKMAAENKVVLQRSISDKELFQQNGVSGNVHVSGMYFYDDSKEKYNDGKYYYDQYMKELRDPKQLHDPQGWREIKNVDAKDASLFNVFEKTNPANGQKILRVIGKPEAGSAEAVHAYLKSQRLQENSHIERGHIFHYDPDNVDQGTSPVIVLLGGCGSYGKTSPTLGRNPNAYIISNDDIGHATDNVPLINAMDEKILAGGGVVFHDIAVAASKNGAELNGYIMPEQNAQVIQNGLLERFKGMEEQKPSVPDPDHTASLGNTNIGLPNGPNKSNYASLAIPLNLEVPPVTLTVPPALLSTSRVSPTRKSSIGASFS